MEAVRSSSRSANGRSRSRSANGRSKNATRKVNNNTREYLNVNSGVIGTQQGLEWLRGFQQRQKEREEHDRNFEQMLLSRKEQLKKEREELFSYRKRLDRLIQEAQEKRKDHIDREREITRAELIENNANRNALHTLNTRSNAYRQKQKEIARKRTQRRVAAKVRHDDKLMEMLKDTQEIAKERERADAYFLEVVLPKVMQKIESRAKKSEE
jgi:hypothetical protein